MKVYSLLLLYVAIGCQVTMPCQAASSCGWQAFVPRTVAMVASRKGRRKPSKPSSHPSPKGFEQPTSTSSVPDSSTGIKGVSNTAVTAKTIYSAPALYDLAFGYRNHDEEVEFLIGQHQLLHGGKAPSNVLELAAGPARHAIYALQSNYIERVTAMDNSPEMVAYGNDIADEELLSNEEGEDSDRRSLFSYVQADMSDFTFKDVRPPKDETPSSSMLFDSAWILLGSLQHLTTNDSVISCFQSIFKVMNPGGTLIVELPHPKEIFSMVECTRNGWEIPLEDDNGNVAGELEIVWGDDGDDFDPVTQVRQFTVSLELKEEKIDAPASDASSSSPSSVTKSVREVVPMRHFTTQEIDALARIAGFKVASLHGAVAHDIAVDDEEAFRLVAVLQKPHS